MRRTGWLGLLLCLTVVASAQIEIVGSGGGKQLVDVSGMMVADEAGRDFMKTLTLNLDRSGWFKSDTAGSGSIKISGTFRQSGTATRCTYRVLDAKTGRALAESSLTGGGGDTRKLARELCDAVVMAVKKVPGIATKRIVMVGKVGGAKSLYIITTDGQNMSQITKDRAHVVVRPRWSPDGSRVIYTSDHSGYSDIYEVDLATSRRKAIVSMPGSNIGSSLSPDGSTLAFSASRDGNPELYLARVGGRSLTRLTRTAHATEASAVWSPDGTRIVYVSNQFTSDKPGRPQLHIMDVRSKKSQRLNLHGNSNESPDWGPDGQIAFASRRSGFYQICTYDPRSGGQTQLTSEGVNSEDPSWAPNGRHIVCARTFGRESGVYILDTLGDPPLRLTKSSGEWYSPDWTP